MEMQQRIDALIQMRREKPEHHHHWDHLQKALLNEPDLLSHPQAEHLKAEFRVIRQQELLNFWDEQFHEVVITGKRSESYIVPSDTSHSLVGSGRYAQAAAFLSLGKTSLTEAELLLIKQMASLKNGTT
jgi:hypothetical protein